MHELSIAMSILEVAREEAARHGADTRVEAIHLKVGVLSGVVGGALQSAFELACETTEFENCRLLIEEVPATVYCHTCQAERPVRSLQWFRCVECDSASSDIRQGRDLQLTALELME